MLKSKLKIGLLINSYQVNAWFAKMVEQIANSDYAEITLVVLNDKNAPSAPLSTPKNKSFLSRLVLKCSNIVYRQFIERNIYIKNASASTNIFPLLKSITAIETLPTRKIWSDYFSENEIQQIESANLDVLIRGGFRVLRGGILTAAKQGVWSLHHGDNVVNRGGPPGFWESLESWSETGVILQKLTEDLDNGPVLYRSFSSTNVMSVTDNKSNYYWKSLAFIPRMLKKLHAEGHTTFNRDIENNNQHPNFYSNKLYTDPTASELLQLVTKKCLQKCKLLVETALFNKQWFLMYDIKNGLSSSFWRYKKIMPPKDRFWADPHIIHHNKTYYIFIEELMYDTQKGHISVIEMDEQGNHKPPVCVLDKPYHLSYPFVFENDGDFYMIPETASDKTIQLYKSTEFPFNWQWQMNLMENVTAVDVTLHFDQNKWWLFTNMVENKGASSLDELFIFSSDDFQTTNWTAHKQNPVISDVKKSRPAGALFHHNGNLYRPSQNCVPRYGYGFNINHIKILNDDEYLEETISTISPNWTKNLLATHTFNKVGDLHIIDVQRNRFKWR